MIDIMPAEVLGQHIQQLREARGLTVADVMRETGMKHCTIRKVEAGRNYPRFDTIIMLCQVLGVSPNRLLMHEEDATWPI